jgi:hypothetical protein
MEPIIQEYRTFDVGGRVMRGESTHYVFKKKIVTLTPVRDIKMEYSPGIRKHVVFGRDQSLNIKLICL